jgi:hypothetical protein
MNNAQLIYEFEQNTGSDSAFHHADHVRLAFAYLSEYPIFEALSRFCDALKRFAAARGKSDRYHETITWAYFFLIHERMAGSSGTWEEFAGCNPDLLTWKGGILGRYYEDRTLKSELARKVFLMPDKVRPTSS